MILDIIFIGINIFSSGEMVDGGTMNKRLFIYIVIVIAAALSSHASASTLMPFGRPRAVDYTGTDGKTYTYYCLVKGQSMGFAVEGPVQVDIRTRAGLPKEGITADYQIQVWEEEYLVKAEKFKSKKINAEISNSNLIPAAYRQVQFDSPAGVHNYRLWLVSDNIDTVFVRIYKAEAAVSGNAQTVGLYPLQYFKRVHLYSKKNQTPYYLINKDEGVKLRVTGPTDVIIRARANYSQDMDGRIGYTLSVIEDGKEINTFSATTSKSLSMAYQDYGGVVPSKPAQFVMKVPAGDHTYNLVLKESAAQTISVNFTIAK